MHNTDPLTNAVYGGIKKGIEVCLREECGGSAIILIYSGIDAMAYLGMPVGQVEVKPDDFIRWCDKYLHLPGEPLTGLELYAARCGVVHTYGIESKLSRQGKCRMIGYSMIGQHDTVYDAGVNPDFVVLSLDVLSKAFFDGLDRFLVDLVLEPSKLPTVEQRARKLLMFIPRQAIAEATGKLGASEAECPI